MELPILQLKQATKRYGPDVSLGPVSVCVGAQEIVGLTGANGAGKSTALQMLAGVLLPDRGERVLRGGAAIGYVPQDISLYPQLTGRENLAFFAEVGRVPIRVRKRRIDAVLLRMQLSDKGRKRVDTYSGGMKRRLNLALALVTEPDVILLDEPFVGADAYSTEIILSELRQARYHGASVVIISHQTEELRALSDRIVTMENGRIVAEEVLRRWGEPQ